MLSTTSLEYDCHIFLKYLVCQMKNLVFQSNCLLFRTLDFGRNTRCFKSEILKYQVFHTLNLKYQVFLTTHLVFQKDAKSWVFVCSMYIPSIGFRSYLYILNLLVHIKFLRSLINNKNIRYHLSIVFPIHRVRLVK